MVDHIQIKVKEMIGQLFFGDVSADLKQDNRITYCDLIDDDKYVSQFLNVDDLNLIDDQQSAQYGQIEMIPVKPEKIEEAIQEEPIDKSKHQKKRSSFHNFQKHLVTTIRSIIDSSKFGKDTETAQCEKKIWKIFMNSNKINKTLVTVVVGDFNLQSPAKINQYGFKEIVRDFKPSQIKQAQQNIYQEIMKQLNTANLEAELVNRRMKHKKEFVIYFQAFLEELTNGQLQKRMAKCTKLLKNENL